MSIIDMLFVVSILMICATAIIIDYIIENKGEDK